MSEPQWTHHRVTMPEDMALQYLDKLLVLVNKQFLDPGFPIALGMAIDKMRAPLPDNKALTCNGCQKKKEKIQQYSKSSCHWVKSRPPEKGE